MYKLILHNANKLLDVIEGLTDIKVLEDGVEYIKDGTASFVKGLGEGIDFFFTPDKQPISVNYNEDLTQEILQAKIDKSVFQYVSDTEVLKNTVEGLQEVDMFTLDMYSKVEERTVGMQDIDDFTLEMVYSLQAKIEELEARLAALEGGTK